MQLKEELPLGFVYTLEIIRGAELDENTGLWIPGTGRVVGYDRVHNIIPTEGVNSVLSVAFNGGVQIPTWYCGLFTNNYTPVAGDTMATFPAAAGETSAYAEATRPIWNEAAPLAGVITNSANPAVFTANATNTFFGAFLSSSPTKGGTTGVLVSAAKFAAPKGADSGDIARLTASITHTST